MDIPKSSLNDFWYINPSKLADDWNMIPITNDSRSNQANSAMRLNIYLSVILFLCGLSMKMSIIMFIIGTILSIILTGGLSPEDVEHYLNEPISDNESEKDIENQQSNSDNYYNEDEEYEMDFDDPTIPNQADSMYMSDDGALSKNMDNEKNKANIIDYYDDNTSYDNTSYDDINYETDINEEKLRKINNEDIDGDSDEYSICLESKEDNERYELSDFEN
jgi:hypothetical protein